MIQASDSGQAKTASMTELTIALAPIVVLSLRTPRVQRAGQPARRTGASPLSRACRSSWDNPPQTPAAWPESIAHVKQAWATSHRRQTAFAASNWRSAGPVFPSGKNNSGSSPRQAARRQLSMVGLPESRSGGSASWKSLQGTGRTITTMGNEVGAV